MFVIHSAILKDDFLSLCTRQSIKDDLIDVVCTEFFRNSRSGRENTKHGCIFNNEIIAKK